MPRSVEEVRFRTEWVLDGVSSMGIGASRGLGGCCATALGLKGRRGSGRRIWGSSDAIVPV